MGCTTCSSAKSGTPKGCKNNGTCGSDGCNKLTVFDWLSNMVLPNGATPFDCVEVRFKNGRKAFFKNKDQLSLAMGDVVATESSHGHDVGMVSLTGELVKIQMKKKRIDPEGEFVKRIYRKATQRDIDIWQKCRDREERIKVRSREIAIRLALQMKISDIEFQGDGSKCTFYYTAEERVDFRQLIKEFAHEFSTRIEMRQIGFRQEAARLGGIGSCGRELCCSTWLTDFRSVNTGAARYQQLSLNPQKLSGQCGKLKCCLNYELDGYLEALQEFPKPEIKLVTEKGLAVFQKMDIFKGVLWYAYEGDWMHWHKIAVSDVNEVIACNQKGEKVPSLEDYTLESESLSEEMKQNKFENVVGQDSLTRFDKPKRDSRRKRNFNKNRKNGSKKDKQTEAAVGTKSNTHRPNTKRGRNQGNKRNPNLDKKKNNSSE